uniref:Uncharacterized protein n=1 Tax=Anguilla anguilla TaxID=7936 RepID=A0A0E9SDD3_ANGAN
MYLDKKLLSGVFAKVGKNFALHKMLSVHLQKLDLKRDLQSKMTGGYVLCLVKCINMNDIAFQCAS